MSDDFYLRSGARQMQVLTTGRAAALADLESHKLNGDHALSPCLKSSIGIFWVSRIRRMPIGVYSLWVWTGVCTADSIDQELGNKQEPSA
jgi:hypothetical protein